MLEAFCCTSCWRARRPPPSAFKHFGTPKRASHSYGLVQLSLWTGQSANHKMSQYPENNPIVRHLPNVNTVMFQPRFSGSSGSLAACVRACPCGALRGAGGLAIPREGYARIRLQRCCHCQGSLVAVAATGILTTSSLRLDEHH